MDLWARVWALQASTTAEMESTAGQVLLIVLQSSVGERSGRPKEKATFPSSPKGPAH